MISGLAPYLWILLLAVILFIPGLSMFFGRGGPREPDGRRRFRLRPIRRAFGLRLLALAGVTTLFALTLVQFLRLTTDVPVAQIELREVGPQRFIATASAPKIGTRDFALSGDQWQIDARVVRWRLPALAAGVPPLYRLDRLSGRYQSVEQESEAERTAYALNPWDVPDIGELRRRLPNWLPFVDVVYGSGAYMPMFDGARYRVYVDARGALFVRPDDARTADGLKARGW